MAVEIDDIIRIARLAGNKIKELREAENFTSELKFGYELVTSADIASNELILAEIKRQYPGHRIISEESANTGYEIESPTWIIDPIDGTVGYANYHNQAAVSIGFAQGGRMLAGAVFNPFTDEMFYAEKGKGAFLNGKPIHVKAVTRLNECVIATGFPHKKENLEPLLANLAAVLPHIRDLRRMGSAALDFCWVACGRLQGYYEGSLAPWDMAAGKLIAAEAGAATGHYGRTPASNLPDDIWGVNVLASSPGVFEELKALLQ